VPNENFQDYSVSVFPDSHEIFEISASRPHLTEEECIALENTVKELFRGRHGLAPLSDGRVKTACQDGDADVANDSTFLMVYTDLVAERDFFSKVAEERSPKRDDSGL
jgi:hypothetical protein